MKRKFFKNKRIDNSTSYIPFNCILNISINILFIDSNYIFYEIYKTIDYFWQKFIIFFYMLQKIEIIFLSQPNINLNI